MDTLHVPRPRERIVLLWCICIEVEVSVAKTAGHEASAPCTELFFNTLKEIRQIVRAPKIINPQLRVAQRYSGEWMMVPYAKVDLSPISVS